MNIRVTQVDNEEWIATSSAATFVVQDYVLTITDIYRGQKRMVAFPLTNVKTWTYPPEAVPQTGAEQTTNQEK